MTTCNNFKAHCTLFNNLGKNFLVLPESYPSYSSDSLNVMLKEQKMVLTWP